METAGLPILLFAGAATLLALGMLAAGKLVGPKRIGAVKEMPYESGMDPVHDTRRRFDVRFHLVAIAFLIFDVELLFLYPWAVAGRHRPDPGPGIDQMVAEAQQAGMDTSSGLIFGGVLFFLALVVIGFIYDWRKGVLQWR